MKEQLLFQPWFLGTTSEALEEYRQAMDLSHELIRKHFAGLSRPYSGMPTDELSSSFRASEVCPEEGIGLTDALISAGETVLRHSVAVHHPLCAAHLHCPPMIPALAAEAMISATNQSMDSWDQSPAATFLEEKVIAWLCQTFGYPGHADGVFTSGGTQSNLMGLLLARDHFLKERFAWNTQKNGLPSEAEKLRILCSETAHFTVRQSASLLGLGDKAVVPVENDEHHRISLRDLDQKYKELKERGLLPFALVATAGTTDFGAIDPLPELASRAKKHGLWLHVDAAYGGAVILSDRNRAKLAGIEEADSITVDFHKLFYQPISCGAFLVKDKNVFRLIRLHADYLNPEEDEAIGIPHLVSKSIQTTRRFDALKCWISFRSVGRKRFAEMIDHTLDLARETANLIAADPRLEALNPDPCLNAVVFRYRPKNTPSSFTKIEWQNLLNRTIRHTLLQQGKAIIAQTKVGDAQALKLTLLNPLATIRDVESILDEVKRMGIQLEMERGEVKKDAQNAS